MQKLLSSILLAVLLFLTTAVQATAAQAEWIESSVTYTFGEEILFQAVIASDQPLVSATIFFQAEQDTRTILGKATIEPITSRRYQLSYTHKLSEYAIRPFSDVEYRFEIDLANGELFQSPTATFQYTDNRYTWRKLEEHPFSIYWYAGDLSFAQSILDVSQESLLRLEDMLELQFLEPLSIYVYSEAGALLQALNPSGPSWIAGHADPDLGVVLVTIPAGSENRQTIEQRIPHELTHIALYQTSGTGYYNLPTFLNEGLASLIEMYPNQDYATLMDHAVSNDTLLPIASLCKGFPRDASNALLSYAQSASFTKYLYTRFGTSGIRSLITSYANGLDCESGFNTTFGTGLPQLDSQWRQEDLQQNVSLSALRNFLPWLAVLVLVLVVPLLLTLSRIRMKTTNQPAPR